MMNLHDQKLDQEFQVRPNILGTLTVNLLSIGTGSLAMSTGSLGGFIGTDINSTPINAQLLGATIGVVPVPATAWLFSSALALMGFSRRQTAHDVRSDIF